MFRFKISKVVALLVALVVLSLVLTACGSSQTSGDGAQGGSQPTVSERQGQPGDQASSSAVESIKVGLLIPQSGNYAPYGLEMGGGFKFIVEKINKEGGIKKLGGAQIDLVVADDASDAGRSANEARRLITEQNVVMLAGFPVTPLARAVAPVSDQYGIPAISFGAGGAPGERFFTVGFPYDRGYAGTMVSYLEWLVKEKGVQAKNVVIASSNNETGQAVDEALDRRLKEAGFNVVGRVPLDMKAQDLTPTVLRIKEMKPDAIVSFIYTLDGIKLQQARYNLNYHDPIWIGGTGGYTDPQVWRDLGDQVARATLTNKVFGFAGYSPGVKQQAINNMIAEAEKANLGIPLATNFVLGAQAARIVQEALEIAGSTDKDAIFEALKKVNIPPTSDHICLPRPQGISFAEDRTLKDVTGVIVQWTQDGKMEVVYPTDYATTEPKLGNK